MQTDRYDLPISASSEAARDDYVEAVDIFLAAKPGMVAAFEQVTGADPDFALGWAGLARARQVVGDVPGAQAAMAAAQEDGRRADAREAAHIGAMALLIAGRGAEACPKIRALVAETPRDAMLAQTCCSVFGLIGFSGAPGREAELLAYTTGLLPHYGAEDWWMLSQHAFSLCETGQLDRADAMIDRSLALNPQNAHAAHIRSHVWYESGAHEAGRAYLDGWLAAYPRDGLMHGDRKSVV